MLPVAHAGPVLTHGPRLPPACAQGYGKRIMFGIEVWVAERGLPLKISATVDAAQARLIAFYESLGAVTEQTSEPIFPSFAADGHIHRW